LKAVYQIQKGEIDSFVLMLKASYPDQTLKITVETAAEGAEQEQPKRLRKAPDASRRDPLEERIMVIISNDFLVAGGTGGVGFTNKQIAALGVPWPPQSGWKKGLIGKTVSLASAREFMQTGKTVREPAYIEEWLNKLKRAS
jgi:hypothetical protein